MVLEDAKYKHGEVVARIGGERLGFVRGGLWGEEVVEVVLSAVAMAEAARTGRKGWELGVGLGAGLGGAGGEMAGEELRAGGWWMRRGEGTIECGCTAGKGYMYSYRT